MNKKVERAHQKKKKKNWREKENKIPFQIKKKVVYDIHIKRGKDGSVCPH